MVKHPVLHILFCCIICTMCKIASAQVKPAPDDTFFLAKQKGLLGRLGKSMMRTPEVEPVKISNPFLIYAGRIIRSVEIIPFGFDRNLHDTNIVKRNLAIRVADKFHVNTRNSIIRNYLFFKPGDRFIPFLISDNEKFLRDQPFLQDALIDVAETTDFTDSIDIIVITRDVFSIGGSINANNKRVRAELREENLGGAGSELSVSGIYDMDRKPRAGLGAEIILRNIKGSFLNWSAGYNTFRTAYNSGRFEENASYTRLEKPFVNRYTQWTAVMDLSYNKTMNAYVSDSLYQSDFEYKYNDVDIWAGYNIGYRKDKGKESEKRLRHFVAGRVFYHKYDRKPVKFDSAYNYNYADMNGVLFTYNLYRQNFYRTNFIFAFGRNEDVPVGLSASLIGGWSNTEDQKRPYYGVEFEGSRFTSKKIFSSYKLRAGGYFNRGKFEDINLLVSIDHFTRLRKLSAVWLNRNFLSFSFTRQVNYSLNRPLFLRSDFGLPYFSNGMVNADERITARMETVFFNLNKTLGFRLAPFLFYDIALLKPTRQPFSKLDGYSAIGGGIRARNENLVFGTIELKGFYFPRTIDGMQNWKIDLVTKVRFKFNSTFVRKPDFIIAN